MLEIGEIIDEIGSEILPEIAEEIFPFQCNILSNDESNVGTDGGVLQDFSPVYENIPCIYEPKARYAQEVEAGKRIPVGQYDVMMPRKFNDVLLDVKPGDQVEILENGSEPGKTFEVFDVQIFYGAYLNLVCKLPDAEVSE